MLHLNGPPGIGKSTIARRYADDHPDVLNCDVDALRRFVAGWQQDFERAGELVRPAALAMITAYLGGGHDVLLPQMLVGLEELARFESAATHAGAGFVELVLMDTRDAATQRFHRRDGDQRPDRWHAQVRSVVADGGGDHLLHRYYDALVELTAARPDAVVIESSTGAVEETYAAVLRALA